MAYEERRKHASRWRHMGLQLIFLACRLLQQMVLTLVKGVGGQIDESLRLQHVQEKREIVTAISL